MKWIWPAASPWTLSARSFITLGVRPGSVVTDLVAASKKPKSRAGSVRVSPLITFLIIEATNICCR